MTLDTADFRQESVDLGGPVPWVDHNWE